jgi:AAA+ superfamily predicted ATPase
MNTNRNLEDWELAEMWASDEHASINPNGHTQWSILANDEFVASYPTVDKLPAGFYELKYNSEARQDVLRKKNILVDELFYLPSNEVLEIVQDIKNFWEAEQKFKDYKLLHKRGILLYGDPGCGKSGIIQLCTSYLVNELNGIVLNIDSGEALEKLEGFLTTIRKIEPKRPIIAILEDIDGIAGDEKHYTSLLLNMLDGLKQTQNIVYISTTNYPEKLEERFTNRPSRFDRRYHIDLPNSEVREAYLRHKISEKDLSSKEIKKWVQETEGMSLAHLKELVVSVIAMGNSFEHSINLLKGLKEKPKTRSKASKKVGF